MPETLPHHEGGPRTRARTALAVLLGVLGAVPALVACTGDTPEPAASAAWEEPAWFAEQAQDQEEYRSSLQGCLDGMGWDVTVDRHGGVEEPFADAELERFTTDVATCRTGMGLSPDGSGTPDEATLRTEYSRLRDTWLCLRAHDVDLADPPSEDTWLDAAVRAHSGDQSAELWHPYADPAFQALPMDRATSLETSCPQPWSTS